MLVEVKRILSSAAIAAVFCGTVWSQAAQGQAPSQPQGQAQGQGQAQAGPNWKDRAEYDLVQSINAEMDPTKRLALLNQWKEKYPTTDFKKVRAGLYVAVYQQLKQYQNLSAAATELMSIDPNDVTTYAAIVVLGLQENNTGPEMTGLVDKAAQGVIANIDKKPANVTDEQWKTQRGQTLALAHRALAWTASLRKDPVATKENYIKSLEADPTQAAISYALGQAVIAEKDEKSYPVGLYHVARAAYYDGPGSYPAADRKKFQDYVARAYKGFHGDMAGFEEFTAKVKASALPGPDYKLLSVKDVHEAKAAQEAELAKSDPSAAMWKRIHEGLSGEGEPYFDQNMKDARIENLRGYLVEQRPKELVLAMSDNTTPQVTLQLDSPMPGKAEPGTQLTFSGVGKSFTKEPFMLTMETERKDIKGWPAAAPAKKPAGAKKAGGAKRRR